MSLVICSNIKDENDYDENASQSAAYRFQNSLKQTFKIPENSEVAVQSVKLNKSATFNISRADKWFQFWGPDLMKSKVNEDITIYKPVICFPKINAGRPSENVGLNDFIDRVDTAINVGVPHPDFYGLQSIAINRNATTQTFEGYKITSVASADLATEQKYATGFNNAFNWDYIWEDVGEGLLFTPGDEGTATHPIISRTGTLSQKKLGHQNTLELRSMPLSHKRGEIVFGLDKLTDPNGVDPVVVNNGFTNTWQLGLTREIDRRPAQQTGANYFGNPENWDEALNEGVVNFNDFSYDIVVSCEGLVQGGPKVLKIHHATSTQGATGYKGQDTIALQPIDYYSWTGAPAEWNSAPYDLVNNPLHLSEITFRIENEIVSIIAHLSDSAGDGTNVPKDVILTSFTQSKEAGSTASKGNYPIPFGQCQWNMYPRIILNGKSDGSTARAVEILSYKTNPENDYNGYAFNDPDNSWEVRLMEQGLYGEIAELNVRKQYLFRETGLYLTPEYQGLTYDDAATPTAITGWLTTTTPPPPASARVLQLILAPSTLYYGNTLGANLAPRIGFEEDPILSPFHNGTELALSVAYVSTTIPSAHQTKSLFIRLDNLTQASINAGVGRPSKILYHVPRFDSSNRDHGTGLYYEPTERTYIKLNNSEPLYLNEFQLSIANDNEKLAYDLVGKTIICLHFKKSSE